MDKIFSITLAFLFFIGTIISCTNGKQIKKPLSSNQVYGEYIAIINAGTKVDKLEKLFSSYVTSFELRPIT